MYLSVIYANVQKAKESEKAAVSNISRYLFFEITDRIK